MNEDIIYEKELDLPEDWPGDAILVRDGKGNVVEIEVPDDIEEG